MMRAWSSSRLGSSASDSPSAPAAAGYPSQGAAPEDPSATVGDEQADESLVLFLARYGYHAADSMSWQSAEGPELPEIALNVIGHQERDGHTWYQVDCSLSSSRMRPLTWQVSHRLAQLREDLHDPVKAALDKAYDEHFGRAPFAHIGGPRGTTGRLAGWCAALAACINAGACQPSLVGLTLRFVEVPPPPTVFNSTKSVASSAASKMREKLGAAKDSAKEKIEKAQVQAAQKMQDTALGAAKANPKAAAAASSAAMNYSKQNPQMAQKATSSIGSMGFSAMKQNPKMALSAAKLAAKANFSRG